MLALPQNLKHAAETETHAKEQLSFVHTTYIVDEAALFALPHASNGPKPSLIWLSCIFNFHC